MRIAMLAPINWPLPPGGYGPWELVAHNLTEGLVALGHDVTLFAAAGTNSSAKVVETCPYAMCTWPEEQRNRPRQFDPATGGCANERLIIRRPRSFSRPNMARLSRPLERMSSVRYQSRPKPQRI